MIAASPDPESFRLRLSRSVVIAITAVHLTLALLLALSTFGNLYAVAYYTPYNMSRQQFEAVAHFGPWVQEGDGKVRSYVLDTPEAMIRGRDRFGDDQVAFGKVELKRSAVTRSVLIAVLATACVIWPVSLSSIWASRAIRHYRRGRTTRRGFEVVPRSDRQ